MESPNYLASGNILPATFVKFASGFEVAQATANTDKIAGVSQEGIQDPPGLTGSGVYAATDGNNIAVYGIGQDCLLTVGAGQTPVPGDFLTTDASGAAVVAAPGGGRAAIGAIARQAGVAGDKIRVTVDLINIT